MAPPRRAPLVLLLSSLLLVGLAAELGLRLAAAAAARRARVQAGAEAAPPGEFWAVYDPDLGYRLNPRFGDINADGLRDRPLGPKGARPRLVVLGDSVGFYGDTVDDTWVAHLRAALPQAEVVNASIKGYTNYQELLYLKKYGLRLEPDLVGVAFCLNDLHRFLHSFVVQDGRLAGAYEFSEEVLAQSRPAPLVRSHLLGWTAYWGRVAARTVRWKASGWYSFDFQPDISKAWKDPAWPAVEEQLGEMLRLGRQNGFGLFVTVFPVVAQYRQDYLARDRQYVLKPQHRLQEICGRLRIPYYDLYPDLEAGVFGEDGLHLTPPGRRRVGGLIAGFLRRSPLVPAAAGRRSPVRDPPAEESGRRQGLR